MIYDTASFFYDGLVTAKNKLITIYRVLTTLLLIAPGR